MNTNANELDVLLLQWDVAKKALETAKSLEMDLRKMIVAKAFPDGHEGTNTKELGHGYQLKAAVKMNYTLDDNDKVSAALTAISKCGNQGSFIAERLVNWKPSLSLSEYRELEAFDTAETKQILNLINSVLTIKPGAPTLEIKEPRVKK